MPLPALAWKRSCPVSERLIVESVMGAPPGTESTAGSRDCTTTLPLAGEGDGDRLADDLGHVSGPADEPGSVEVPHVFGTCRWSAVPVVPARRTPRVGARAAGRRRRKTGPPTGRQGPCWPSLVQPIT